MHVLFTWKVWFFYLFVLIASSAFADTVRILTVRFWQSATVEDIKSEIANGANFNNLLWHKKPLLFVALEHNPHPDVILFLMNKLKMDPFTKDGSGYDGFYYLKKNKFLSHTEIPQVLLQKKKRTSYLKTIIKIALVIFVILGGFCFYKIKRKLEHGF